jgi:hypothetical protein
LFVVTLAGIAAAVVIGVVAMVLMDRPRSVFITPLSAGTESDRWAAVGTAFGFGAFMLAVLGTVIAIVAYGKAVQRPALTVIEASQLFSGPDETSLAFPAGVAHWTLLLGIRNDGPVAATNVAVRVSLESPGLEKLYLQNRMPGG